MRVSVNLGASFTRVVPMGSPIYGFSRRPRMWSPAHFGATYGGSTNGLLRRPNMRVGANVGAPPRTDGAQ